MGKGTQRKSSKCPGVYFRPSEQRTHKGKPDLCCDISYKREARKLWEKVGWASEGYTTKLAVQIRAERLRMIRHGQMSPKEKAKVQLRGEFLETGRRTGMRKDKSEERYRLWRNI